LSVSVVRFLTRNGCHLCDEARSLVLAAARRSGIEVLEVDIDDHEELVGEFGLRIPVVLGADGQVLAEGIIEEKSLRRALRD
jgi:thioredoxin-like negative regulator of GroEL